ncbi:MAG: helix-turn-helix domain-containing protein [Hyphomonas sp.]
MTRPAKAVRGSTTGRPIMVLLDLAGQRWTLRILWELQAGPETFRGLQTRCGGISPTVLNTRLKSLRDAGLVEAGPNGYVLTPDGEALGQHLLALDAWAQGWADRRDPRLP